MKKLFILVFTASLLAAPCAQAQDMFNHVSLGVSLGIDGIGLQAAAPVGDRFQLRAGYSFFPYSYSNNVDFGSANLGGTKRDLSNVPLTVSLWKGGMGNILADYYPTDGPFRLTAGFFVGSGKLLNVTADLSRVLTPDEYGTLAIGLENGPTFSTDKKGIATIHGMVGSVMPYLGIGVGRAVSNKTVSVTFDLGIAYTGGPKVQSYNYIRNTLDPSKPVETITVNSNTVENKDDGIIDKVSSLPILPMMKLGVFFKLF